MTETVRSLLAYSPHGHVMVIAQDREVLVYSGADESPLWRCECDADIVAVRVLPQSVFALDQSGMVNRWDALTGDSRQTVQTGSPGLGMDVAANGDCAIVSSDEVAIVRNASVIQSLPLKSITAVAWSADGSQLACAEHDGRLGIYPKSGPDDTLASQPVARTFVSDPIRSMVCHPDGSWVAASGNAVWQLNPQRAVSNALMNNTSGPPQHVALSSDGRLLAFSMEDHLIVGLYLNPNSFAGTITYQDRVVTGLAFGPDLRLGIGLDTGDGNLIDFGNPQGSIARTDPHPGRPLNRWMLNVAILPRLQASAKTAISDSISLHEGVLPSWAGPVIGPVIGFVVGLSISHDGPLDAAVVTVIFATLIGLAGGGLMWFIDNLKKNL